MLDNGQSGGGVIECFRDLDTDALEPIEFGFLGIGQIVF